MIRRLKIACFGLAAGALTIAILAPSQAVAQNAPYGYAAEDAGGFSLGVGGMVGIKPKYEGSDEYEVFGLPLVFPKFGSSGIGDRVKVRGADDVRFRAFEASGLEFGPLAGYAFGRDEDDGELLRGLGDVDDGLVLGAYAAYTTGPFLLETSYHHIVTGDDNGYLIRFGGGLEHTLWPSLKATLRGGATFADNSYNSSYFGISALQAQTSGAGLAAYSAEAGIKDVHIGLGAALDLTDSWTLRANGKYTRLLGDAGDSPIVESQDQFSALLGVTYTFDLQR